MGYDVHITRAEHWSENEGHQITPSEWHDVINSDPDLRLAGYNGPHFAIWDAHPKDGEAWLDWHDGNITTKNPDEPLLNKMVDIATRLNAKVQGDDGELYDDAAIDQLPTPTLWGNTSLLSLILSIVALTMLAIVIPLDSFIRQHYPVGTPMPMKWAFLLVGPAVVGVLAWLIGMVFAAAAFLFRQPKLRFAGLALIINCTTGIYFALTK